MIRDSAGGLFDVVLVWKLDRFARNRYDSAHYKAILKKNGVKVVSAKEAIAEDSTGILLESLLEGYAEFYSVELSEKIHRGQKENALKGKNNGGGIPLGYVLNHQTQKLEIDPLTAPLVVEIFTRYADGETVRSIVDDLNGRGLRTRRGKPFRLNSFSALLKNRKYIGEYQYQDVVKITLEELYTLWLEKRAVKLGASNRSSLKSAYKHCSKLAKTNYKQIKSYQMQDCIDGCGKGYSTQGAIKNLWGHLDRFAMELDIIMKCNSDLLTSDPIPETTKEVFTDEEVSSLWENQNLSWVDSILFFIYTGFRISEMLSLQTVNVDLKEWTMRGGVKTEAGKNRLIPVHSKIQGIVQKRFEQSKSGYLFEYEGKKVSESKYREIWADLMGKLQMEHTPHECRHTFRSRLDSAGANKVCIDRLMGHKSKGTGERVYTHKNIEELRMNIELITN